FGNIVVYLRGLAANAILLLPWLLLAAAFTIWSNPTVRSLTETNVGQYLIHLPISVKFFGLTLNALLAFTILLALWALWRSTPRGRNISDVGADSRIFGILLAGILIVAFCELQPLLLAGMLRFNQDGGNAFFAQATSALERLAGLLASIGA